MTDDGLAMNSSSTSSEDLGGRRLSNRGTNVAVTGNRIDIKVCKMWERERVQTKLGIYMIIRLFWSCYVACCIYFQDAPDSVITPQSELPPSIGFATTVDISKYTGGKMDNTQRYEY